jgi:hypothetical protein
VLWKHNKKMDFREIGCKDVNWIQLSLDTVQWWVFVKTVMNVQVP